MDRTGSIEWAGMDGISFFFSYYYSSSSKLWQQLTANITVICFVCDVNMPPYCVPFARQ